MTTIDPTMETPLSQQAVTESEVALERMVRNMIISGYEACEKGLPKDEVVGETLAEVHPVLTSVARTLRMYGVTEERALAAEKRLEEQHG